MSVEDDEKFTMAGVDYTRHDDFPVLGITNETDAGFAYVNAIKIQDKDAQQLGEPIPEYWEYTLDGQFTIGDLRVLLAKLEEYEKG